MKNRHLLVSSLMGMALLPVCALAQPIGGPGGFAPGGFGPGGFAPGGFAPGGVGGPGAAGGPNTPLGGNVNASSDARTNTVVVSAPRDMMEQIVKVISEIDANPVADNVVYVYKLKNGSALNVEAVANMLFNGTGGNNRGASNFQTLGANRIGSTSSGLGTTGGGRGGAGGVGAGLGAGLGTTGAGVGTTASFGGVGGGTTTTGGAAAGLEGQVSVVADPNTNSLLVSTNPKNWPRIKLVLDTLDRSVPQVLIKVLIAEVTHEDSLDLGADMAFMNMRFDSAGSLTEGTQVGSAFAVPGFENALGRGGIFQISESQFSATIRALDTTGKLDVLSRPYILASDNQLATITVGQTVPYVTGSTVSGNTGGVTNTVNYSNVGILLDVIPHINPDGMVILDVAPQVSALLDSRIQISADIQAPVFSNRSAQTRIAVENNQTVVIGGLMQDQKNSIVSKVPLLGDVPWLGQLFRSTTTTKTKTELLIFLTPHVAARPDMLQVMQEDEVRHTKLIENSVAPGVFQDHMEGMKAGAAPATTQSAVEEPHELIPPDQRMRQLQQERQMQVPPSTSGRGARSGRIPAPE